MKSETQYALIAIGGIISTFGAMIAGYLWICRSCI